ncbi:MAG: phosphoglycerate dehydrogenase [Candidatus Saccharimonadales bacterium]
MTERVALMRDINPVADDIFVQAGLAIDPFEKSASLEELTSLVSQATLLGVRSGPSVPGSMIEASPDLEAIGCFCVGTNHVDLETASNNGVAVFNSVHENTRSVAELVIANTFGMLRRIPEHSMRLHGGEWTKTDELSYEIRGKTMGIIGYGTIGSQVSDMAEGLGMDVVYFDPASKFPSLGRARQLGTMEEVLETADVVTIHVPGGASTKNMIDADALENMRPGSYLINTSRGDVVDNEALAEALESRHLAGAAIDVFVDEPKKKGAPFEHILQGVGRAVLTPHIAGSTIEAQCEIALKTAQKLVGYLRTGNSNGSVNLPEIMLNGQPDGTSRILNIHENVTGASASIDSLVAEAGLNIVDSILKTRGQIGYAAIDVEGAISDELISEMEALPPTRRARVIAH